MADRRGKIRWYAPDPRAILGHDNLHVSRSLRATIRKGTYEIRIDSAFEKVMRSCGERKETWINEEFLKTYTYLHTVGLAHSIEAWCDGILVALSPTENMFERRRCVSIRQWKNASRLWCDERASNGQVEELQP
jgi:Leucyl/phenylalanyl-tRNA protein transferase